MHAKISLSHNYYSFWYCVKWGRHAGLGTFASQLFRLGNTLSPATNHCAYKQFWKKATLSVWQIYYIYKPKNWNPSRTVYSINEHVYGQNWVKFIVLNEFVFVILYMSYCIMYCIVFYYILLVVILWTPGWVAATLVAANGDPSNKV